MPRREPSRSSASELVGLAHLADVPMDALPGGHQRLVDVARAIALEPYAVLLDEPAAGLDHGETADLGQIIRRMADAGIAVLLVEHDMRLVMKVADRVVVLDRGRKLADGSPAEVAARPAGLDAYLGVVAGMRRAMTVSCRSTGCTPGTARCRCSGTCR